MTPRISASSYSNTAPLIWSFLYGSNHGKVELVLDNAPARSAELLAQDRVDAALVPAIAYQTVEDAKLIPNVCVGTKKRARSVCLMTRGIELESVRSVALDASSKTSVVLTKLIFREFLGHEPEWIEAAPELDTMFAVADCALLIGDPALKRSAGSDTSLRIYDLAGLWHAFTGLGFVFAMWMTRRDKCEIDFAATRDEGLARIPAIAASYAGEIGLSIAEMEEYLTENISFEPDETMRRGMELYFDLAADHGLIVRNRPLEYL